VVEGKKLLPILVQQACLTVVKGSEADICEVVRQRMNLDDDDVRGVGRAIANDR
jgi:hypothetical protein